MVRNRWSVVLGLCLIAPIVWSSTSASADRRVDAVPNGSEVRITRPALTTDGRVDTVRTQAMRTETVAHTDTAAELELLTSGANLVSQPELGPTVTNPQALGLHKNGYTGRVRIGIIDFFSSALLASEATVGELKPIPASHRKCLRAGKPCSFSTSTNVRHGNAMAEIISDEAPGAELFIAQASTVSDYRAVIDWFAANGVKIVNHSLIGNYDGPGNGTGPQAALIDYAVSKGMAWFNAAGDMGADTSFTRYAGGYWRGTWSDPDNDGWLNFKGTDETLGAYCGALLGLRWSDWGAGRTDYDLWVNDVFISTGLNATPVVLSNRNQTGVGAATPLEGNDFRWLCNTNSALGPVYDKNKDGFVALKVKRSARSTAASSTGDKLEIQVNNGYLEWSVDGGAVGVGFADTKNPGAATIGHMNVEASHGPTNDGRIKPDIVTEGCSPTSGKYAYGPCETSTQYLSGDSAAAKTSGVAAAVLDALGPMKPAQLVQYLRNEAAGDHMYDIATPHPVPNNREGFGMLRTRITGPQPAAGVGVRMRQFPPIHILDTRTTNNIRFGTAPLARNSSIVFKPERDGRYNRDPSRTVVLNVTTSGTLQAGTVQIGPAGWTVPGTTTTMVVQAPGQTVTTMAFVPVGPTEEITINTTAGGHFHVDLLGVYSLDYNDGLGFHGVDPYRTYDTRAINLPLTAGVGRNITIVGSASADARVVVPPTANAVMISLTADSPAASGTLSAVPTSITGTPDVRSLQVVGGRASTTTTFVPLDSLGRLRVWSSVNTHLQIDVLGWFSSGMAGGLFHSMPAVRMVDTRRGGAVPAAGSLTDVAASTYGVPTSADALAGQLFSSAPTTTGHMRIGRNQVAASSVHREVSVTAVNRSFGGGTVTGLDSGHATIAATNITHRIFDAVGWFDSVGFAVPGSVFVPPIDPVQPTFARAGYVLSPDLNTMAYATYSGAVYGITVWHRDTGVLERYGLDTGSGTPDAVVVPEAVSNGGTRLVLQSKANNLTADANDGGLDDRFVLETATKSVRRINETADGTRVASVIAVDAAATTLLLQPNPITAARDLLSVDIATGATSPVGPMPISGYNSDLTAAADDTMFWTSRGGGKTIPMATIRDGFTRNRSASPDGRYLYFETSSSPDVTAWLYDSDTATTTPLCQTRSSGVIIAVGGVDWSDGPPSPGTWCTLQPLSFGTVTATGFDLGPGTYDGRIPQPNSFTPASYQLRMSRDGLVVFSTSAYNFIPGYNGGTFIYDRP